MVQFGEFHRRAALAQGLGRGLEDFDQFQTALTLAAEKKIPLYQAEQESFGASHAGVAAYLLGLWGLPVDIVEAVAFHHTPLKSELRAFGPLTAVHAANVLEQELSWSGSHGRNDELDAGYVAALGLDTELSLWRAEAVKLFNSHKGK